MVWAMNLSLNFWNLQQRDKDIDTQLEVSKWTEQPRTRSTQPAETASGYHYKWAVPAGNSRPMADKLGEPLSNMGHFRPVEPGLLLAIQFKLVHLFWNLKMLKISMVTMVFKVILPSIIMSLSLWKSNYVSKGKSL